MVFPGPGPRLGTQVMTMSPELRAFFGAPEDAGLLVQHIEPGSAAEKAKVRVGDVLIEVDGKPIEGVADVRAALDARGSDEVDVVVVRNNERKTLRATLPPPVEGTPSIPPMPHFELPPDVERRVSIEVREQLQQQLEQAREQLEQVQRQLESMARSSNHTGKPTPGRKRDGTRSRPRAR